MNNLMPVLIDNEDIVNLFDDLNHKIVGNTEPVIAIASELVNSDFLIEVRSAVESGRARIYFGKTLKELRIVIEDDEKLRDHEIFVEYRGHQKLYISRVNLPSSFKETSEYQTIHQIIDAFQKYINELANYFYQLEYLDQFCTVMEPVKPSFREEYRRILLDDRIWLHIDVTSDGLASNIDIVGHSQYWQNKLESGLLDWDHDKNIVDNILAIFELETLPQRSEVLENSLHLNMSNGTIICGICLCTHLPHNDLPQPLCQNASCGVYYHQSCLYQWLMACAGGRPSIFGVATGTCPTCLHPISCRPRRT